MNKTAITKALKKAVRKIRKMKRRPMGARRLLSLANRRANRP